MVRSCIICKEECVPSNLTGGNKIRSFHKFPNDNNLKEKWLSAIGRASVAKTARICSDHFKPECFNPLSEFTISSRKTLLLDAIPFIATGSNETLENENAQATEESASKSNNFNVKVENCMDDTIYMSSPEESPQNPTLIDNTSENSNEKNEYSPQEAASGNSDQHSLKRKNSMTDIETDVIPSKFCFKDGNGRTCVMKNSDCVSQDKFRNFYICYKAKLRQVDRLRKQIKRRNTKILSLKELKQKLAADKEHAVVEYLQSTSKDDDTEKTTSFNNVFKKESISETDTGESLIDEDKATPMTSCYNNRPYVGYTSNSFPESDDVENQISEDLGYLKSIPRERKKEFDEYDYFAFVIASKIRKINDTEDREILMNSIQNLTFEFYMKDKHKT